MLPAGSLYTSDTPLAACCGPLYASRCTTPCLQSPCTCEDGLTNIHIKHLARRQGIAEIYRKDLHVPSYACAKRLGRPVLWQDDNKMLGLECRAACCTLLGLCHILHMAGHKHSAKLCNLCQALLQSHPCSAALVSYTVRARLACAKSSNIAEQATRVRDRALCMAQDR